MLKLIKEAYQLEDLALSIPLTLFLISGFGTMFFGIKKAVAHESCGLLTIDRLKKVQISRIRARERLLTTYAEKIAQIQRYNSGWSTSTVRKRVALMMEAQAEALRKLDASRDSAPPYCEN